MTPEQLQEHVQRLKEEVDREREERSYFQLERDKVNSFWEITKKQLEESKATIRVKERELEDAEERHQVEIKVYKQKVKHLLYEHQNNVTELKQEGVYPGLERTKGLKCMSPHLYNTSSKGHTDILYMTCVPICIWAL